MRRASRVDGNQQSILDVARALDVPYTYLYQLGGGIPDVLLGIDGLNILWEIKVLDGVLNDEEQRWHDNWRGQVTIVRDQQRAADEIMRWKRVAEMLKGESR
jgi:hypothetical protein